MSFCYFVFYADGKAEPFRFPAPGRMLPSSAQHRTCESDEAHHSRASRVAAERSGTGLLARADEVIE
jgi:hypothetical protein